LVYRNVNNVILLLVSDLVNKPHEKVNCFISN